MGSAKSFRDLKVYQAARDAASSIFELSNNFPPEERYSLTDQIRRSSRAVKAMIAADDFCKCAPGTDYRSIAREEEEPPFTDH
jgi:hypothetical protein